MRFGLLGGPSPLAFGKQVFDSPARVDLQSCEAEGQKTKSHPVFSHSLLTTYRAAKPRTAYRQPRTLPTLYNLSAPASASRTRLR